MRKSEDEKEKLAQMIQDELTPESEEGAKKRRRNIQRIQNLDEKRRRCLKESKEDFGLAPEQKKKVKVENMPDPVLEKVFSYLDWKDLGSSMLVCQRWKDVAGHPLLWTKFPLHLNSKRLIGKAKRLSWVKSVTITLPKRCKMPSKISDPVLKHFTRIKELIFQNKSTTPIDFLTLMKENNKIARIGIREELLDQRRITNYIAECWDVQTNTFIKNTINANWSPQIVLQSYSHEDYLSYEVLETICKAKPIHFGVNNLMIDKSNMTKLAHLLKHNVRSMQWLETNENQDVASLNVLLDLLNSKDPGMFKFLLVKKDLLLKSHWVEKLGGKSKVEASATKRTSDVLLVAETGLKMRKL